MEGKWTKDGYVVFVNGKYKLFVSDTEAKDILEDKEGDEDG